MKGKRWQDWVMLALGAWLSCSPLVLSGALNGVPAWNAYILGAGVMIFALFALSDARRWEEWVNLALALWLLIAPFVLRYYRTDAFASWNQIIVGALIGVDAIWALVQRPMSLHA